MTIKKLIFPFELLLFVPLIAYDFIDITKLGYEQYQDIIVNGQVIKPASGSRRDCEGRYQIIRGVLDAFKRPFTMVDLGASQGYYSFRAASDYDAVCVMIEGNNSAYPRIGDQLFDLCKINALDNIILLNKHLVIEDLKKLGLCEHFDVVLALNIIHWFPDRWREMTDAILNLGDKIIIETPPQEKFEHQTSATIKNNKIRKNIENYLLSRGARPIGQVMRHTTNTNATIYLVEHKRDHLSIRSWLHVHPDENSHVIKADDNQKQLIKISKVSKKRVTSNWIPGINLITFKMYNGTYPVIKDIVKALASIRDSLHPDWMPNNMILQGSRLSLIDYDREDVIFPYSLKKERGIIQWLQLTDPLKIKNSYFTSLATFK